MSLEDRVSRITNRRTAKARVCKKLFPMINDEASYNYLLERAESASALTFVDVEKLFEIKEKGSVAA
jgi:hypothetical protein